MKLYKMNLAKFLLKRRTLMYIAFLHWPFIFSWFLRDVLYYLILMVPTISGSLRYISLAYRFYWSDRKKRLLVDRKEKRIVYGKCDNFEEFISFEYTDIYKIVELGLYVPCYVFLLKSGDTFSVSSLVMNKLDESLTTYFENIKPFANYAGKPELFICTKSYL